MISLSFQNIGGLDEAIVKSKFLLISNSLISFSSFLDLFKKTLIINIQSSLLKLLSFKMFIVFFLFFDKQLSTSSETL